MAPDPQGTVPDVPDHPSSSGQVYRRRFITLRAEHSLEELDLELPADRRIGDLVPEIVRALGWPETSAGETIKYQVFREAGELLDEAATLAGVGVENSDVLWIRLAVEAARPAEATDPSSPAVGGAKKPQAAPRPLDLTAEPPEPRGSLPPPVETGVEIAKPSIVSREGVVFELGGSRTLIGRSGRGFRPDVDLTDLDPEYAASRRHAVIEAQGDEYVITALRTTNGTYVNGTELAPGAKHRLGSSDDIQFGSGGVKLTFFSSGQILSSSFFK